MDDFDLTQATAAVDLEHRIDKELTGLGGPLGYVLLHWRRAAILAAADLLRLEDPHDWQRIQTLRTSIDRYKDAIAHIKVAVENGRQAWEQMTRDEREAFAEILAEDDTGD